MKNSQVRSTLRRLLCIGGAVTSFTACNQHAFPLVETVPPTPAPPATAALVAARTHYFGAENVDASTGEVRKDLLIMSWATNTTFVAAINGKVVFLDASLLRREEVPGRTPTTLTEMVNLMPSYIFVGKAAPGYIDLAANIAFRTGATVVGAQEHCDAIEQDARVQQKWAGVAHLIQCTVAVARDQAIGATTNALSIPALGVCVRAIKHSDIPTTAPAPAIAGLGFDWASGSDTRDAGYWPVGVTAQDSVGTAAGKTGPSVLYHLTLAGSRNFGLVWNDRTGALTTPVAELLRKLPKTDLQIGSVDTSNALAYGLIDPASYIQAVQPKLFFPAGHDAASQRAGAANTAEFMKRALESAMTALSVPVGTNGTQLRVNFDPSDYIKPHYMTFDPSAPTWQRPDDRPPVASCN